MKNKKIILIVLVVIVGIFGVIKARESIVFDKIIREYEEAYTDFEISGDKAKNILYIDTILDIDLDEYKYNSLVGSLWKEYEDISVETTNSVRKNIKSTYKVNINVVENVSNTSGEILLKAKNGKIIYNIME
ncbi:MULTISPECIES: hypothetical protein [unclassified Clostridioides]|uniref:hypothetical protein n=1 Tax=unclassified Clostridioides TaxID=2635829 RepID=UPI001D127140|nr:hypothetical protein [Clostridioides sp. ES-S-0048-02]